ncbi:hypothetical protein CVCC1112_3756 [Paenarthrobacter nicotinovorans]|nr:hypothetical protein CVCC1112_3756 [Paenarthrobacter nicotinovorans]
MKGVIWMDFLYRYGPLERVLGALSVQKLRFRRRIWVCGPNRA